MVLYRSATVIKSAFLIIFSRISSFSSGQPSICCLNICVVIMVRREVYDCIEHYKADMLLNATLLPIQQDKGSGQVLRLI